MVDVIGWIRSLFDFRCRAVDSAVNAGGAFHRSVPGNSIPGTAYGNTGLDVDVGF